MALRIPEMKMVAMPSFACVVLGIRYTSSLLQGLDVETLSLSLETFIAVD